MLINNIIVIYLFGVFLSFCLLIILEIFFGDFLKKSIIGYQDYIKISIIFSLGSWFTVVIIFFEIIRLLFTEREI